MSRRHSCCNRIASFFETVTTLSTSFIRPVLGSTARTRILLRPSDMAWIPGYRVYFGMLHSSRGLGSAMTQDYSVEICGSEPPDAATTAGRAEAAGADEVADGGGGAVAEVGRGFGSRQEGGGGGIGGDWHSWLSWGESPA